MTGLKDLLRKKDKIGASGAARVRQNEPLQQAQAPRLDVPEFKIIRSTTEVEEVIEPPTFEEDAKSKDSATTRIVAATAKPRKSLDSRPHLHFRKSSNAAVTKDPTAVIEKPTPTDSSTSKNEKHLSSRLHFRSHSRTTSADSSDLLPENLPDAPEVLTPNSPRVSAEEKNRERETREQREAQWEKRATLLAQAQKTPLSEQTTPQQQHVRSPPTPAEAATHRRARSRSNGSPSISDARGDDDIQEAIRLHEIGELGLSTAMLGRLGDPEGQNNALAQVLYGLALRHGWGVTPEPDRAVQFLSLAAANSARVESAALDAGVRKGGAAKGELVLAMFELANCLRHGWGVKVDAKAARAYYETAANLGDVDAMEEAAWCFLEGFGGPKDKLKAAQYLRLAEEKGRKQVGNSWIWKDKYNPK